MVIWKSRIWVVGWWIARALGLLLGGLCSLWRSKVWGTIKLGHWAVTEVCLVLLILSLNLLLLFQNSFLLLQEREVNENAVDEDLSLWFMSRRRNFRKWYKLKCGKSFVPILTFSRKLFFEDSWTLSMPKERKRIGRFRKMHWEMFEREIKLSSEMKAAKNMNEKSQLLILIELN